jgi:hypothetical protein
MSSMSEGIAAVERIAEELEDAGVKVRALRDCGLATSTDGDHVHATIEMLAPVDGLTETDEGGGTGQDTTTDDTDADEVPPSEAGDDDAPRETRCGDADDEPAAESASDANVGSEGYTIPTEHYHDDAPGDVAFGPFAAKDYGLLFSGDIIAEFEDADRVTICERNGRVELVAGTAPDGRDYAVGDTIQMGRPALEVLDATPGDKFRGVPDGGVVVLERIGDEAGDGEEDLDENQESDGEDPDADQEDVDEGQTADATEEIDAAGNGGGSPDGHRHRLARRVVVPRRRRREQRAPGAPRHARVARRGRRPRGPRAGHGRGRRPTGFPGG